MKVFGRMKQVAYLGAHIIELKKVFENTLATCDSHLPTIMNHLNMNNTNSDRRIDQAAIM